MGVVIGETTQIGDLIPDLTMALKSAASAE
jgi:hypothetical protein